MKYLLDTNVFRELGRAKKHENVRTWMKSVNDDDLAVSTITVREVWAGITNLRAKKPQVAASIAESVKATFEALGNRVLPVDHAVAQLWGKMLGGSRKHVDDIGIAATAKVHELVLLHLVRPAGVRSNHPTG